MLKYKLKKQIFFPITFLQSDWKLLVAHCSSAFLKWMALFMMVSTKILRKGHCDWLIIVSLNDQWNAIVCLIYYVKFDKYSRVPNICSPPFINFSTPQFYFNLPGIVNFVKCKKLVWNFDSISIKKYAKFL